MKKTAKVEAKKPAKKVAVRTEPVEQPPAKVVETVNEGVQEIAKQPEKIHHVANAGD